jgi:D-3-phosphoglycerate dehydrogenase
MDVATELGVAVINAPAGNTVAVAELFFGGVLGPPARAAARARGDARGAVGPRQLPRRGAARGARSASSGLGRIGGEVAHRAQAFGAPVVAYDPYVGDARFQMLRVRRRAATLEELLDACDVLTVHTPLTDETRGMIGRRELARLSPGAVVVNMARGGIVDEAALAAALEGAQLRGAVLDVFTAEPPPADHPLRRAPNLLLTPHLGANTAEAQRNVAVDVCEAVRDALLNGELSRSMNVAAVDGAWREIQPAALVARRAAAVAQAVLADLGARALQRLTVRTGAALAGAREALLSAAALGAVEGVVEQERLNMINARAVAAGAGWSCRGRERVAAAQRRRGLAARGHAGAHRRRRAPAEGTPRSRASGVPGGRERPPDAAGAHQPRRPRRDRPRGHAARRRGREHRRVPPGAARPGRRGARRGGGGRRGAEAVRGALRDLPEVHGAAVAPWRE